MENIPAQEEQTKRPFWRKIPGFRSGKAWKMIVACMVYGVIVLVIVTPGNDDGNKTASTGKPATTTDTTTPAFSHGLPAHHGFVFCAEPGLTATKKALLRRAGRLSFLSPVG